MVFQRKKTEKSTALSVRAMAAQVILQVLDQGKSLSTLLPDVQLQVKPQDLPLLQEITFGICRVLPRLENIIKKLLDKPLKGKTRIVHCLLLVGLYQLLYMRVPAHAAVDEVVNATKSLKSDSFRGLVNGVLRRFLREQEDILAVVDKHWQTLHPEWFVNKLKKLIRIGVKLLRRITKSHQCGCELTNNKIIRKLTALCWKSKRSSHLNLIIHMLCA